MAACTPSADSDVVFLPTPRAVNVVKALQSWILAETDDDDEDNDVDEEVESAMLSVFIPLSPILQGVNGSHWPFIFDVLEGALERLSSGSSDSEPHEHDATGNQPQEGTGLVSLARALRLVLALEELSRRNKSLMEEWKGRRMNVLAIIRDLGVLSGRFLPNVRFGSITLILLFILITDHRLSHSTPLSTIRQLALSILQHLPFDLLDETTLAKLVGLTQDSSVQVQKTAYQLLQKATKKRTEHFVIEAGVDTEQAVKPLLPIELMEVIMQDVWVGDEDHADEADSADVFGYLLGWMLVFDSFADAVRFYPGLFRMNRQLIDFNSLSKYDQAILNSYGMRMSSLSTSSRCCCGCCNLIEVAGQRHLNLVFGLWMPFMSVVRICSLLFNVF